MCALAADRALRLAHDLTSRRNKDNSSRIRRTWHRSARVATADGPLLVFLEDASDLNARVQQSKLASLGRLSASIAHEIRNPVGAMSHAAQLLAEAATMTETTPADRHHPHAREPVSHIIDNILQLSRRESSRPERFDLDLWIRDFASEFTRTLELQEGELSVTQSVARGLESAWTRVICARCMWNLCDNAVKYASETGGILVELQIGRIGRTGQPYLDVLDQGRRRRGPPTRSSSRFLPRGAAEPAWACTFRENCANLTARRSSTVPARPGGSIFRIVFSDPDRWDKQD